MASALSGGCCPTSERPSVLMSQVCTLGAGWTCLMPPSPERLTKARQLSAHWGSDSANRHCSSPSSQRVLSPRVCLSRGYRLSLRTQGPGDSGVGGRGEPRQFLLGPGPPSAVDCSPSHWWVLHGWQMHGGSGRGLVLKQVAVGTGGQYRTGPRAAGAVPSPATAGCSV